MAPMHTDQIDRKPKNRPIEARLALLVNWFIIGIGILYQFKTLYICEIICLTLWRIISINCLNETTTTQNEER